MNLLRLETGVAVDEVLDPFRGVVELTPVSIRIIVNRQV